MNRNYLNLKTDFLTIRLLSMRLFLILLLYCIQSQFIFAQTRPIPINNIRKVHKLNVTNDINRYAVVINDTVQNYEGRSYQPYSFFYEFNDGTYYVGDNSYVIADNYYDGGDDVNIYPAKLTSFKITAKYIEGDDPPLAVETGNDINFRANPPNAASQKNNSKTSFLDISHNTKSIVLREEYVIAINLGNEMRGAQRIMFLYNETDKKIFSEGILDPRPLNDATGFEDVAANILKERGFSDYYQFENPARNIFINLKTLGGYYKGYSARDSITIEAITLDDDEVTKSIQLKLKLLPNNARAHDPNDIIVSPACIDSNKKIEKLSYTVNFQNIGGRPAEDVIIDVSIPGAIDMVNLNPSNFRLNTFNQSNLRLSNPMFSYRLNTNKDEITFTLKGINLKGTAQSNTPVKQTMGSITYDLPLKNDTGTQPIISKATILFKDGLEGDPCYNCNGCTSNCKYPDLDPIITPPAITTFKKFQSLKINGIKAGLDFNEDIGIFAGITASPNTCNRKLYNQFELMFAYQEYKCNRDSVASLNEIVDTAKCRIYASENNIALTEWEVESKTYTLGVVPFHLRYDLANGFSLGGGIEFGLMYRQAVFYQLTTGKIDRNDFLLDSSLFVDFNFNTSNYKPTYGLRYLNGYRFDFTNNGISNSFNQKDRLQAYVQLNF